MTITACLNNWSRSFGPYISFRIRIHSLFRRHQARPSTPNSTGMCLSVAAESALATPEAPRVSDDCFLADGVNKEIAAVPAVSKVPLHNLPSPQRGETNGEKYFFERMFLTRTDIPQLLKLASDSRGGSHGCHFGVRCLGTYKAVFFIKFDDGVEWAVKMPRANVNDEDDEYLKSEHATMVYLHSLGNVPVPKVYGACFNRKNPAKAPYFFMDKVPGIPLSKAITDSMDQKRVQRILSQLAQFKKTLFSHPHREIGSHSSYVDPWGETFYTAGREYTPPRHRSH